jgi:C_GCAxxG_C_C family probable redox protein
MTHPDPVEQAVAYFAAGYLCSQSLLLAYAPSLAVEPGMAARIAAPFGAGMGRMGRTCGAVTGALMVIGVRYGHRAAGDEERKEHTFELVREFLSQFEARNGSVVCRDLLGYDVSTAEGLESARAAGLFEIRCPKLVRDAAEIVGQILGSDAGYALC